MRLTCITIIPPLSAPALAAALHFVLSCILLLSVTLHQNSISPYLMGCFVFYGSAQNFYLSMEISFPKDTLRCRCFLKQSDAFPSSTPNSAPCRAKSVWTRHKNTVWGKKNGRKNIKPFMWNRSWRCSGCESIMHQCSENYTVSTVEYIQRAVQPWHVLYIDRAAPPAAWWPLKVPHVASPLVGFIPRKSECHTHWWNIVPLFELCLTELTVQSPPRQLFYWRDALKWGEKKNWKRISQAPGGSPGSQPLVFECVSVCPCVNICTCLIIHFHVFSLIMPVDLIVSLYKGVQKRNIWSHYGSVKWLQSLMYQIMELELCAKFYLQVGESGVAVFLTLKCTNYASHCSQLIKPMISGINVVSLLVVVVVLSLFI